MQDRPEAPARHAASAAAARRVRRRRVDLPAGLVLLPAPRRPWKREARFRLGRRAAFGSGGMGWIVRHGLIAPSGATFARAPRRSPRARAARRGARWRGTDRGAATRCRRAAASPGAAGERAVAAQRDAQDRAERERPAGAEVLVADEVAERVGDQAPVISLHAADHVRARADHEIRAGVDDRVREAARVAAVLAQERLGARAGRAWRPSPRRRRASRRRRGRPSRPPCARAPGRRAPARGGRPAIGREAEQARCAGPAGARS